VGECRRGERAGEDRGCDRDQCRLQHRDLLVVSSAGP
jgi:hypothetical protein